MIREIKVPISDRLSGDEWKVLKKFCEKARRLTATRLASDEGAGIRGQINFSNEEGIRFKVELPPEEQISEFLMAFRFFYLQKEKTHFPKIIGIIGRHTENEDARKALKLFGNQWGDSLFGQALYIHVDGQRMTSSVLLDLWFNANYFHSNEEKERDLEKLQSVFPNDFAKFMLLDAVFESSKVIFKLFNGLRDMVEKYYGEDGRM